MIRATDDSPSIGIPEGGFPLIIDCGANIGVSVLEWKSRWPMSKVICFEPDPDAFRLLKMNVDRNDIPGVQCIEAAVAAFDGTATLHGQTGRAADARGNSLKPEWGKRESSQSVEVKCVRLSSYLRDEEVAFLKLDIEGAEESVLHEIAEHLHRVQSMYVEVHENDLLHESNSLDRITTIIQGAGMTISQESRYQAHALPQQWLDWGRRWDARQTQLVCYR